MNKSQYQISTAMKTFIFLLMVLVVVSVVSAQTGKLPETELKTLDGIPVSSTVMLPPGNPTILVFWKSNSEKCCDNLESMQSAWTETLREKGVKIVAICVDCKGSWGHVKPMVMGKAWDFETYIDVNGNFMRAMSVNSMPCTILFDKNLNQVCRYNGYCSGGGEMICTKVLEHLGK